MADAKGFAEISNASTPQEAKQLGRQIDNWRQDWQRSPTKKALCPGRVGAPAAPFPSVLRESGEEESDGRGLAWGGSSEDSRLDLAVLELRPVLLHGSDEVVRGAEFELGVVVLRYVLPFGLLVFNLLAHHHTNGTCPRSVSPGHLGVHLSSGLLHRESPNLANHVVPIGPGTVLQDELITVDLVHVFLLDQFAGEQLSLRGLGLRQEAKVLPEQRLGLDGVLREDPQLVNVGLGVAVRGFGPPDQLIVLYDHVTPSNK